MKKLYTLLFSFLLSAAASAQITLTVDGVNVPDKATYTHLFASEAEPKIPGMPQMGMRYGLYPEIFVTSQKEQDVIVTITDKSQDPGTQFCGLDGQCSELYLSDFFSQKTQTFKAGQAVDLAIHVARQTAATGPYEVELLIDAYGTQDNKRVTSTVILRYDPEAAANMGHVTTHTSGEYYTLSGQRVGQAPLQKGIYVKNGRKVVIK